MATTNKTNAELLQELADAHQRITQLEEKLATIQLAEQSNREPFGKEQQPLLQAILDNIPAGVFVAKVPTGKPLLANKKAQELLGKGISPSATSSAEWAEVYAAYRYETEELYPTMEMPLVQGMSGHYTMVDDMEIRKPSGENTLLQVHGAPVYDDNNKIIASVAIFQDITQRKHAEETLIESEHKFRSLLEFASEGMIIINQDGIIISANSSAETMFGYQPDELLGQHVEILLPEGLRDAHIKQRSKFISSPHKRPMGSGMELMGQRKDGSQFPVDISLSSVKTKAGYVVMSYIIDVTERKRNRAERERLQAEKLEAQQRLVQELSSPIIPLMEGIIVLPLIGSIDAARANDMTRTLLRGITQHRAKIVILDITGVALIDTGIANHLDKTIQAARLKGTRTIVTGISDVVAETVIDLGIDWHNIETLRDLQTGLMVALNSLGMHLHYNDNR